MADHSIPDGHDQLIKLLEDAADGAAINVTVSRRNSKGGESAASDPVNRTMP